jgi:death on curing protein
VIYVTLPELLHVAERALGGKPAVRDHGLLESAAARPRATAFGGDVYPDLDAKAAALLHSLARNHALVDGNKRLALAAVIAFYGVNGRRLTLTNDEAYELIIDVAAGHLDSVEDITARLRTATEARPGPGANPGSARRG